MQVTFIEALDQLMPGFDPEISKLAQRVLINPRKIDYHTGVFASKVSLLISRILYIISSIYSLFADLSFFFTDHSSKRWKTSDD